MLRKYLNSKIDILYLVNESLTTDAFIIQTETINENTLIVEHCKNDEICDLIPFTTNIQANNKVEEKQDTDAQIDEYRELVLNNDPLQKYSGHKLGEIIDAKDKNWIKNYIDITKNAYIKERITFLAKHYNLI